MKINDNKNGMKKKKKVILSTFGPLHLIKSAEYLTKYVDIEVVQGWIPQWWNKWLIGLTSKIVGRDLSKSFGKRTPVALNGKNHSVAIPEFYLWGGKKLGIKDISAKAAKMYGKMSKHYLENQMVFHVRSGSGQGGAITKAKQKGMKVVVDHSIAHPAFMDAHLRSEYDKYNVPFDLGLDSHFWQLVLADCNEADVLVVNSFFVKETFVKAGYDTNKIRVVYLGVRDDFQSLKTSYSLTGPLKILYTGSFGFRKGGEYLLKAMEKLDGIGFDYELYIVGGYSDSDILKRNNKARHVHFVGHVPQDDLKEYLATSDCYLFPSLCEGCAQSGMEALTAGLPVIATYESGLPITDGETGLIIKTADVSSIVDAILKLKGNENLRKYLGKNAAQMMKSKYTWDIYARQMCEVYNTPMIIPDFQRNSPYEGRK